jgi:hypothetical protein
MSMDMWVSMFGAKCAAWLIWEHRKNILKTGGQDFQIPKKATTPPWFRVAIETLKQREHWRVYMTGGAHSLTRNYRVLWLRHRRIRAANDIRVVN